MKPHYMYFRHSPRKNPGRHPFGAISVKVDVNSSLFSLDVSVISLHGKDRFDKSETPVRLDKSKHTATQTFQELNKQALVNVLLSLGKRQILDRIDVPTMSQNYLRLVNDAIIDFVDNSPADVNTAFIEQMRNDNVNINQFIDGNIPEPIAYIIMDRTKKNEECPF